MTTHSLAVSGQNVAYVVAGVLLLAWVLGIPRPVAVGLALVAILGYVLAVGLQPSVVRAGVAGGLSCLAWLASRARDRWYSFLVAACALLAWNPYVLRDPGFQLSFAAVAAIFVCVPRLERRLGGYPVPVRLASVLAIATACGVATAPILWFQFGAVPLLTVPANAAAEPVVAPILALGLGAAALDPVLPGAAAGLGWLNGWLAAYLAACGEAVGGLPFAQTESGWVLLAVLAAVLAAWRATRLPRRLVRPALAVTLVVALGAAGWFLVGIGSARTVAPSGLRISFLDVGQGDAALIEVPEGAVLVDQGPPEARVVRLLEGRGVRRLAALVLTHPQLDHVGGAPDVARRLPVDVVLTSGQAGTSPEEQATLAAARARGERIEVARRGQVLALGRLRLEVLWPDGPGSPGDDPNQHAIVLLARYGGVEALFTADAESDVTGRLAIPQVDVLKVAHHGSADAGLGSLLDRIHPVVAVVSVGEGNDYGHPHPGTMAVLDGTTGLRWFRTDRHGTVTVESDGTRLSVRSSR
ncbi:MAG: ComEC/Rec2 family competence protein [Thermoleophilia bacterium]